MGFQLTRSITVSCIVSGGPPCCQRIVSPFIYSEVVVAGLIDADGVVQEPPPPPRPPRPPPRPSQSAAGSDGGCSAATSDDGLDFSGGSRSAAPMVIAAQLICSACGMSICDKAQPRGFKGGFRILGFLNTLTKPRSTVRLHPLRPHD